MDEILHQRLPADLTDGTRLPGTQPLTSGRWLEVDEAYAAQMAYRRALIASRRDAVLWQAPAAAAAVAEVFTEALALLPTLGFEVTAHEIHCPDGARIARASDDPLALLGRLAQEDICIMQKNGAEHVLTAAVLCFPASWTLAEKAGRPLIRIHAPVDEYDEDLAKRVQRLFDGVQVGRPLWRNNLNYYDNPELFQPRSEAEGARAAPAPQRAPFLRAERQCILRLPKTKAVVFSIHSFVVRSGEAQT